MIAHNTEQHCDLWFSITSQRIAYYPQGANLLPLWEPLASPNLVSKL